MKLTADGWKDYGDLSAVATVHRVAMSCDRCKTRWYGCWDNFQCPECGEGELPWCDAEPRAAASAPKLLVPIVERAKADAIDGIMWLIKDRVDSRTWFEMQAARDAHAKRAEAALRGES